MYLQVAVVLFTEIKQAFPKVLTQIAQVIGNNDANIGTPDLNDSISQYFYSFSLPNFAVLDVHHIHCLFTWNYNNFIFFFKFYLNIRCDLQVFALSAINWVFLYFFLLNNQQLFSFLLCNNVLLFQAASFLGWACFCWLLTLIQHIWL